MTPAFARSGLRLQLRWGEASDRPVSMERAMIGYVTLGTNDLARATAFYDAIAGAMGIARMMETARYVAWGKPGAGAGIGLTKPFDGRPATVGNGSMVALEADSEAHVDRIYEAAMQAGATDEGAPGPRGGFYAAYFRDPDGNKLNAFFMAPPSP